MDAEERALLTAIVAHPDEDAPRLIYADWLDEHASTLPPTRRASDRAELIRVQVELSSLTYSPKFDKRKCDLEQREDEILAAGRSVFVGELPAELRRRGVRFALERGFVGGVRCSVSYFAQYGAALMDAAPVTAARLDGLNIRNLRKLISSNSIARLHTLMLSTGNYHDYMYELLKCAAVTRLTALYLDNTYPIGRSSDALIERVVSLKRLVGLKRLMLHAAEISERGAEAILRAEHLANLEVLDLRANSLQDATRDALRAKFGPRVWFEHADVMGFPTRDRHLYGREMSGE